MRYFLNTATESLKDGKYQEYGEKVTKGTGEDAKTNAIAELHTTYATMLKSSNLVYWMGKVEDTEGNVIDKLECGKYVEPPVTNTPSEETGA